MDRRKLDHMTLDGFGGTPDAVVPANAPRGTPDDPNNYARRSPAQIRAAMGGGGGSAPKAKPDPNVSVDAARAAAQLRRPQYATPARTTPRNTVMMHRDLTGMDSLGGGENRPGLFDGLGRAIVGALGSPQAAAQMDAQAKKKSAAPTTAAPTGKRTRDEERGGWWSDTPNENGYYFTPDNYEAIKAADAPAAARMNALAEPQQGAAGNYLSSRKTLARGVTRHDAGLETPGRVYATVDANGNRVYTDDAVYAGRVSNGRGLTRESAPQGEQYQVRAGHIENDANRGLEYADPTAVPPEEMAQLRATYAGDDVGLKALDEMDRSNEIEAARRGERPVDERRRQEASLYRNNLYQPGYGDDLSTEDAIRLQLAMRADDRAERSLGFNQDVALTKEERADKALQLRAQQVELGQMESNAQRAIKINEMLQATDKLGMSIYDSEDLLGIIAPFVDTRDPNWYVNDPLGPTVMALQDQGITRHAQSQGGFFSSLDDDARFGAGDLEFTDPEDPGSNLYAYERPGVFDIQGRYEAGRLPRLARTMNTDEERAMHRINFETGRKRKSEKDK